MDLPVSRWCSGLTWITLAWGAMVVPARADAPRGLTPVPDVAAAIDRHIDQRLAQARIDASPLADEAEFLRRAFLDITGTIPSAQRAAAFLDDRSPDKRARLIDELLASPAYGKHFGQSWVNQFIRRDANMPTPPDPEPLVHWLADRFNDNRGWGELVADLLTGAGPTRENPQVLFFNLNGDSRAVPQPNVIAGSIAQLFLGVQMQCAECHDHPLDKWLQEDFWGMAAFFAQVRPQDKIKITAGIVEAPDNSAKPRSKNGPPIPKGAAIVIPADSFRNVGKVVKARFPAGAEPALREAGPFRPAFAAWLTSADNPYFARNAANRLWAHFFGHGFVTPLNDFREDNPPSHPELLDLLAREFAASGFDQKHLIRCICTSKAYQRTSRPAGNNKVEEHLFARMEIKVLSPTVLFDALQTAMEVPEPQGSRAKALKPVRAAFVRLFDTREDVANLTEFTQGVPQALRMMNDPRFNSGAPIVQRLLKSDVPNEKAVAELYLAALARRPSAREATLASEYLARQSDRKLAIEGLLWTLLNRSEFMLNH